MLIILAAETTHLKNATPLLLLLQMFCHSCEKAYAVLLHISDRIRHHVGTRLQHDANWLNMD